MGLKIIKKCSLMFYFKIPYLHHPRCCSFLKLIIIYAYKLYNNKLQYKKYYIIIVDTIIATRQLLKRDFFTISIFDPVI
jgi:hypothetical protein